MPDVLVLSLHQASDAGGVLNILHPGEILATRESFLM